MSQENYETFDIPGAGELRARPGTSTAELAGAVKYWHSKCRVARLDGILTGTTLIIMAELVAAAVYYAIR